MKPGGGKNKGGAFERQICKELSLWMSGGVHDDWFWRSAMSGGRATVQFKKGGKNQTQCGDITAIHPQGSPLTAQFLVSCKFYQTLQIAGTVFGNKGGLTRFWKECVTEAERFDKSPMLIAKQNNTPVIVCLNSAGVERLEVSRKILAWLPPSSLRILWFSDFLKLARAPK